MTPTSALHLGAAARGCGLALPHHRVNGVIHGCHYQCSRACLPKPRPGLSLTSLLCRSWASVLRLCQLVAPSASERTCTLKKPLLLLSAACIARQSRLQLADVSIHTALPQLSYQPLLIPCFTPAHTMLDPCSQRLCACPLSLS